MTRWSIRATTMSLIAVLLYLYTYQDIHPFRVAVVFALYYLICLDRVPVFDWTTKKRRTEWCWVWQKAKRWELWEQEKEQFYEKQKRWQQLLDNGPTSRV